MKTRNVPFLTRVTLMLLLSLFMGYGSAFAEPANSDKESAQLCDAHRLPASQCFYCDPSLREAGRLWCAGHDRYEDRCFICHPDLQDPKRLWCDEHHLYEDECIFCHPELVASGGRTTVSDGKSNEAEALQCLEHQVPEDDCGICHPDLLESLAVGEGLLIRLESEESATKAGVLTALPTDGQSLVGLVALSRVTYDLNHLVRLTPLSGGVVQRVLVDVGDDVAQGQALVELASPEVALAQKEYLSSVAQVQLAKQVFDRAQKLSASRVSAQKEFENAVMGYQVARNEMKLNRQKLLNLGLSDQQVKGVKDSGSVSSRVMILAPFSGTMVERKVVAGEAVAVGDQLLTLVDLSSMWLDISIPEDRLELTRVGYFASASFASLPGQTRSGQISWLAPNVDARHRTVQGRVILANPERRLKDGMYGKVHISPQQNGVSLKVPASALHMFSGHPFIFVKVMADLYEIRRVQVGGRDGQRVDILAGVVRDEQVVVTHSFIMKSEFLKSRLGAGCVDD